jgi:hypothetical protein
MRHVMKKLIAGAMVTAAMLSLYGCESAATKEEAKPVAQAPVLNNQDLYEVVHEGRYYVFDDFKTYQEFLQVGETAYRKVMIGAGPHGETLVYGLTGADKKKLSGIASVEMFNGRMEAAEPFYGEMRSEDGRLYVFSSLKDMEEVRMMGEAPLRFTQIGAGPQGQTVVFVLNAKTKKHEPVELVARFKQLNGL